MDPEKQEIQISNAVGNLVREPENQEVLDQAVQTFNEEPNKNIAYRKIAEGLLNTVATVDEVTGNSDIDPSKVGCIHPILYLFYKANTAELEVSGGVQEGENKNAVMIANSVVDAMDLFSSKGCNGRARGLLNIRVGVKTEVEPDLDKLISGVEKEQKQTKFGTPAYNYLGGLKQFFLRIKEETKTK